MKRHTALVLLGLTLLLGIAVLMQLTDNKAQRDTVELSGPGPGPETSTPDSMHAHNDDSRVADENRVSAVPQSPGGAPPRAAGTVSFLERNEESRYPSGGLRVRRALNSEGIRDGLSEAWYEDGTLWERGSFQAGKKHGEWRTYHPNGTLREMVTYHNGNVEGVLKSWFEDGRPFKEKTFLNGVPNGECTTWHGNGQMQSKGSFADGVRSGAWTFWTDAGEFDLAKSGRYLKGVKSSE